MNILEDPLIKKHFSTAERVISAMQEPITSGDTYLVLHQTYQTWEERQYKEPGPWKDPFHPFALKVPK